MATRMRLTRKNVALLAGIATLVAGGVASGSIPDANKVFTGCMLNKLGTIRLIDKSLPDSNPMSHCLSSLETEITWNQKGSPGPIGPPGAQGQAGTPGKDGVPGMDGINGANGRDGKDGVSVANTAEPPGANCAGGGSRFTVGTGAPTFVCDGKNGTDGTNGTDGKDGTNGTNGQDGVSVTIAAEPAGSNCANGGSKFTAANGVTYACNGADGSGSAGPVVTSRAGHAALTDVTVDATTAATPIDVGAAGQMAAVCAASGGPLGPNLLFLLDTPFDPVSNTFVRVAAVGADNPFTGQEVQFPSANQTSFRTTAGTHAFSEIIELTNGYSIDLHGIAFVGTPSQGCSMVYHLTVSKN